MRVLLVEDNARLRALTQRQLRDAGFAIDAVGDLAEAEAATRGLMPEAEAQGLALSPGEREALRAELEALQARFEAEVARLKLLLLEKEKEEALGGG